MYLLKKDLTVRINDVSFITFEKDKVGLGVRMEDDPYAKYRIVRLNVYRLDDKSLVHTIGSMEFTESGREIILNQEEIDNATNAITELEAEKAKYDPFTEEGKAAIEDLDRQIASIKIPEPVVKHVKTYDEIANVFKKNGSLSEFGKQWVKENIYIGGVPIEELVDLNSYS